MLRVAMCILYGPHDEVYGPDWKAINYYRYRRTTELTATTQFVLLFCDVKHTDNTTACSTTVPLLLPVQPLITASTLFNFNNVNRPSVYCLCITSKQCSVQLAITWRKTTEDLGRTVLKLELCLNSTQF